MPISTIGPASLNSGQTGSAPIYAARAWVNFNGTGTVSINAAGNVSSITDNGAGDYTVNFTNTLPAATYAVVGMYEGGSDPGALFLASSGTGNLPFLKTTTQCRVRTTLLTDSADISVAFFR